MGWDKEENYAKKKDLEEYTKKNTFNKKVSEIEATLGTKLTKQDLPDISNLAKKEDIPDLIYLPKNDEIKFSMEFTNRLHNHKKQWLHAKGSHGGFTPTYFSVTGYRSK